MLTVRPVTADAPALEALMVASRHAGETWHWNQALTDWALVLEADGQPLGFASGHATFGDHALLEHFWIRPEARTFRATWTLWRAALAWLRQAGQDHALICSDSGAVRVARLLTHVGARCYAITEGGHAWWVCPV